MQKKNTKKVRLDKGVTPLEYDLKLHPDLENFTFSGEEIITLKLNTETKTLTLHSKEIQIDTVEVLGKNKVFAEKITYDEAAETATFVFKNKLPATKQKIKIIFKGILNDKMRGFYRSSYIYQGKVHTMATTQFEATDARRAFPCFDEPAHKAIFHVSLIVPKDKTAISNTMPISTMEHESGYEVIKFSPSPKMSTYLLAFIVGNFEYIEGKTLGGKLVRVFTVPGKKDQAHFALDCAIKTLDFYENYFEIPYPLPVLDMIAIPDFSSLAMENWGAITYREIGLLVDEKNTSLANKQMVALVIAHELAHQWFGNLVTMEWWTHLWLNEGFASYMEYLTLDKLFPEWNMWTQFGNDRLDTALRLDALKNTHPIEVEVHHPEEIGEIFDEVSYSKGASVIRMLADYLGYENFRKGLSYYLKKHSYKNTETIHLWEALEKVSKKKVSSIMKNWTGKSGHPVISAEIKNGKLITKQERFYLSPISKKESKDKTKWNVPLKVATYGEAYKNLSGTSVDLMLNFIDVEESDTVTKLENPNHRNSWIKLNFGESSVCRIRYSEELLTALKLPVADKKMSAIDRLGLVRDVFDLSYAGMLDLDKALDFIMSYKNEDNYVVWAEIASGLSRLEQIFSNTSLLPKLHNVSIYLFEDQYQRLTLSKQKNEEVFDTMLRSLALARLSRAGHTEAITELKHFWRKMQNGMHIDADIRGVIYLNMALHGSMTEYKKLISMYNKTDSHEEKNRIGGVLGFFEDPKILDLVFEFAFSKHVRSQDTTSIVTKIATNPKGRAIYLKNCKAKWSEILRRYGSGGYTITYYIKALSNTAIQKDLNSINNLFSKNPIPGAMRALEQVREKISANIVCLDRDKKNLQKFLKRF